MDNMEETPADFTLSAEKAFFVLVRARAVSAKDGLSDPGSSSNPSDDKAVDILEDTAQDPTRQELADAIDGLNEDERFDLLALMWIGREDFSADEWADARKTAADQRPGQITRYLCETPLLSDYLEEGLTRLGISYADFERDHL